MLVRAGTRDVDLLAQPGVQRERLVPDGPEIVLPHDEISAPGGRRLVELHTGAPSLGGLSLELLPLVPCHR
ncbi:hypothetical protein [Streptomyces aureus]|uniref:hypothetical protein n=1 Tax=Streptomyces aureus TaxID=193461 RepID=UPI00363832AE